MKEKILWGANGMNRFLLRLNYVDTQLEAYLVAGQTSIIELFCENSKRLKVYYFAEQINGLVAM